MKHLFILAALASFVALSATHHLSDQSSFLTQNTGSHQRCGENEVYTECGPGCDRYCNAGPIACSTDCIPGCYCQDGYSRLSGKCVPTSSCSQQRCGANEEYLECGAGCDRYCNGGPIACSTDCIPGCYCRDGYSRLNDKCVPTSICERQQCRVNEVYKFCGGCDEYCNEGPIACTADCKPGCYCQDGYVRSFRGSVDICIPRSNCPQQQCGVNEEYLECGAGCDRYCNAGPIACSTDCIPGCYCREGYSRVSQRECVPSSICPIPQPADPPVVENTDSDYQCGDTEVFQQCGVGWQCEDYCGRGANACAYCEPGCYCRSGYIRSGPEYDASCIPEDLCPRAQAVEEIFVEKTDYQCGENEVFQQCGVGWDCEDYCGRGANACAYCEPGCYCRPGYVRTGPEYDASCIPENQCPRARDSSPPLALGPGPLILDPSPPSDQDSQGPGPVAPKCFPNEEYSTCGTACPANCDNKNPVCTQQCAAGCFCKDGYIRKHADVQVKRYKCIPQNQCPS